MQLSQSRFSNTPTGRRPPSTCARSRAASPGGVRSRASPSRSARAGSRRCSGRTAPARRRSCASSPASSSPTAAPRVLGSTDAEPPRAARPRGPRPLGRPLLLPPHLRAREPDLLRAAPRHVEARRRRRARTRCWSCRARRRGAASASGFYSHGMQKRLSIARALLTEPSVLLVDEATHDLDPRGGRADAGARAAASPTTAPPSSGRRSGSTRSAASPTTVTLLREGQVAFQGTVSQLIAHVRAARYVLRLRQRPTLEAPELATVRALLGSLGSIASSTTDDPETLVLTSRTAAMLGEALATLTAVRRRRPRCREEQSEIEDAFLQLTGADDRAPSRRSARRPLPPRRAGQAARVRPPRLPRRVELSAAVRRRLDRARAAGRSRSTSSASWSTRPSLPTYGGSPSDVHGVRRDRDRDRRRSCSSRSRASAAGMQQEQVRGRSSRCLMTPTSADDHPARRGRLRPDLHPAPHGGLPRHGRARLRARLLRERPRPGARRAGRVHPVRLGPGRRERRGHAHVPAWGRHRRARCSTVLVLFSGAFFPLDLLPEWVPRSPS